MRDVFAGIVAVLLLLVAASLATTLTLYRKRRQQAFESERARGRTVIAEIPGANDLVLVTEDAQRFYYGNRAIDKDRIAAVRVLINGAPIAAYVSSRLAPAVPVQATSFEDCPEGIARDRWDVAVETIDSLPSGPRDGVVLIECGAIRERVSQELARAVFDAVKRDASERDEMTRA